MIQTKTIITCDRCQKTQEQEVTKKHPPRFFYESGQKFDLCMECQEQFKSFMQNSPLIKTESVVEPRIVPIDQYLTAEEFDHLTTVLESRPETVTLLLDIIERLFAEAASARVIRRKVLDIWLTLSQPSELSPLDRLLGVQTEIGIIAPWESHFPEGPKEWLHDVLSVPGTKEESKAEENGKAQLPSPRYFR